MSKHTPGPWKQDRAGGEHIHVARGRSIAVVSFAGLSMDDESKASARLLVKAPEMAEALRKLADFVEYVLDAGGADELIQARALLAEIGD